MGTKILSIKKYPPHFFPLLVLQKIVAHQIVHTAEYIVYRVVCGYLSESLSAALTAVSVGDVF